MNSAGEEDEEQVDYGGDSGEENSMSFIEWAGALQHLAADAVLALHSG
jgi:hypothetical protein